MVSNGGGSFAEHIRKHVVQFDFGNSKVILRTVFLAGGEICKLPAVAHQIPKLADVGGWNKASGNEVVFEDVGNPFGILLVSFLAPDGFHVLWMRKNDFAGGFQNAVVFAEPDCTATQVTSESGKALTFICSDALTVGRSNAGNKKGFVDVHSTADRINDSEHSTSPQNSI